MSLSEMNRQPWLKWENIEKLVGEKFSNVAKNQGQSLLDNMSWVETYVQDMLKKAMPHMDAKVSTKGDNHVEIFETLEHVIVQVKLPSEEDPKALQVFVKSNQVKLTGFIKENPSLIKLPALVLPKTARARYKPRTLQIQIRKRGQKETYHEAYIRY
jgi:HSP20 family molecular chaperone IbpA